MKLGVCVPYRDRELHLNEFIPKVGKYLKNQGIDFQMYFCHQVDDKLFNRGATKNIAAKHAFEEGCDYIVWHDIDMIPIEGGGCDYSYPKDAPRHIATQISQMNYQLKYHEYFGGAVLFTKEQVEATNGYSNEYWDWGMEDDDLFWRTYKEGLTNNTYLTEIEDQKYYSFDGNSGEIEIPYNSDHKHLFNTSHTVSVLVRAYQQVDKNSIFLIGDDKAKYVEYPIFRVPGYDYGFSFNNSRAISFQYWNTFNQHNYMWLKRYDNQWTWITAVIDAESKESHLYLNGSEVDTRAGNGSPSPLNFNGRLKPYGKSSIYLGSTPSLKEGESNKFFKGDIAKVYVWNRSLTSTEITHLQSNIPSAGLQVDLDFNSPQSQYIGKNVELKSGKFKIPNSILPHRVEGKMRCLPHKDEGIINGKFVKGETTARNEKRYVLQMQQGILNYKQDGIKQVKYEFIKEHKLTPWAKMIDIKL